MFSLNPTLMYTLSRLTRAGAWCVSVCTKMIKSLPIRRFMQKFRRGKQLAFQQLPYFLIYGPKEAGKKAWLTASGSIIESITTCHTFFSSAPPELEQIEVVVTKTALYWLMDTDDAQQTPHVTARTARYVTQHARSPLHGILLIYPLSYFTTDQVNQTDFTRLSDYIETLSVQVPVYCIVTQCDQLYGFSEYVNILKEAEQKCVFGATFPHPLEVTTSFKKVFHDAFDALIKQLEHMLLPILFQEKNGLNRVHQYHFIRQIALLKHALFALIRALNIRAQTHSIKLIRGFYFTCAEQHTATHDLVANELNLPPSPCQAIQRNEAYFIEDLLHHIILPEGKQLGHSLQKQKIHTWRRWIIWCTLPIATCLCFILLIRGYTAQSMILQNTHAALMHTKPIIPEDAQTPRPEVRLVNKLNTLRNAFNTQKRHASMSALFPAQHILYDSTHNAITRVLRNQFLPTVGSSLARTLSTTAREGRDQQYPLLKGYVALSDSPLGDKALLQASMQQIWQHHTPHNPTLRTHLNDLLSDACKLPALRQPLDPWLIQTVQAHIHKIPYPNRAMALLLARSSTLTDTATQNDEAARRTIPILFTQFGYEHGFQPNRQWAVQTVLNDAKWIDHETSLDTSRKAVAQLVQQVDARYDAMLGMSKQAQLERLIFKHQTTLAHLSQFLHNVIANNTPFNQVISDLRTNCQDKCPLSNAYAASLPTLKELSFAIDAVNQSNNKPLAALDFAQAVMSNATHPLRVLAQQIEIMPVALRPWYQSLLQNTWSLILDQTYRELNRTWNNKVFIPYQQTIRNRFPVQPHATTDISLQAFSRFFGPKGILQTYLNHTLMPFLDDATERYRIKQVGPFYLPISKPFLASLSQAKAITTQYFHPTLGFDLSLTPRWLDPALAQATFSFGDMQLTYHHGPHFATRIQWPFPGNTSDITITLETLDQQFSTKTYQGAWSLFRLIQSNKLIADRSDAEGVLIFGLPHKKAELVLSSELPLNALRLDLLQHFTLPLHFLSQPITPQGVSREQSI